MIESMTEGEFLRFSEPIRHKKAAALLRQFHETRESLQLRRYRRIEGWLCLPRLTEDNFRAFSDRYHWHLTKANMALQEHNLLAFSFRHRDKPSLVDPLPVTIYLDNLRSAFNVGSILRTTEAFRLGKIYFSQTTPFINQAKVQKTAMQTCDKVICEQNVPLQTLPKPCIALETAPHAPSIFEFVFPCSFTLMLGNEEYGLSEEALRHCDTVVKIPLYGFKNSLNVASAFAIAAGIISHQLRNR